MACKKQIGEKTLCVLMTAICLVILLAPSIYAAEISHLGTNQKVLVICVKWSNISTTRMASCSDWVSVLNNETNNFYNLATFSQTNFIFETPSGGPINGWYDLGYTVENYSFGTTGQDAISLADHDIDLGGYNRVFVITNNPDFGGQGGGPWWWKVNESIEATFMEDGISVGKRFMTLSIINEWAAHSFGYPFDEAASVGAHELGHQLGLRTHYGTIYFNGLSRDPIDPWDMMGLSPSLTHFIGWSKAERQWIPSGPRINIVGPPVVSDIDATLTLNPLEVNSAGIQIIKIPFTTTDPFMGYVVENRKNINTDQYLPGEGVLVSLVDESKSISPPPVIVMENSIYPGDLSRAPLKVGESFNDSARNISIGIVSQSGNNYNVRVQYKLPPGGSPDPMIIDWGAPPYETVDIWVDSEKNGWGTYRYTDESGNPIGNGDDAWVDRNNRIYAKVHNTGTAPASNVRVQVYSNSPPGMGDAGEDWDYLGTIVFPYIPAGGSAQDFVIWRPTVGRHTCIKAQIQPYPGESSESNNHAQENVDHFDTTSGSPFQPVAQNITVYNPSDTNETPVHFNVRDIPPGWAARVDPTDMILPKGGNDTVIFEVLPSGPPGASPIDSQISELTLRSYSSLNLSRNSILTIAGDLKFHVSETSNVSFYPSMNKIRGAVSRLISLNNFSVTKWDAMNFPALLYDINNNRSTETLYIEAFSNNRTIAKENLWYKTGRAAQKYKVFKNKNLSVENGLDKNFNQQPFGGYYALVGWFGEQYVGLNGNVSKLSKLILEQEDFDRKVMSVSESWDMGDGWVLKVQAVDARASPRNVWFTLTKDGVILDEGVTAQGEVYTFSQNLSDEKNVPVFVTYIDAVFVGSTTDMVQLKYSWLISNSIMELKAGDRFGILEVVNESQSTGFTGKPIIEAYIPFYDTFIPIGGVEAWVHLVNSMDINCRVDQKEISPYIIIQGQLSPPIENALISVEFTLKNMREVKFATTNSRGIYSIRYLPKDNGVWESQAFFSGDNKYEAAESNVCRFEEKDLSSISGQKLNDTNGNRKVDKGEMGLPKWTIQLTKPDGTTVTANTGRNGSYVFKGLLAGSYVVKEKPKKGWIQTYPPRGKYIVNISTGKDLIGVNFLNHRESIRVTEE